MTEPRLLTRPLVLSFLANLAQGLSFFLFVHFPRFLEDLGASSFEIGILFAVTAVASVAVRPAIGRALDHRGRRTVILGGAALNTAVVLLYFPVTALGPYIYAVRILHGFAIATLFTGLFTYAADVIPAQRRVEGIALFGVSGLLPIALGGLIGDLVLQSGDFDHLFLTSLVFGVIALALAFPLSEPTGLPVGAGRRRFFETIRQPDLRPVWWITGIFSLALSAYFTFLRTFIDDAGFGSVGLFFATYSAVAITERLTLGWLPERIGQKRVLLPAIVMLGAGLVVLASAGSAVAVGVAGALCGGGHGFVFPILSAVTVTRASAAERGSAMSIFTALFDVATLIGGPLFGAVIAIADYRGTFLLAAGILAAGTAVFFAWDRRHDPIPVAA